MNGEMLSELRRIIEGEQPVPQKPANRLILAAMVSLMTDVKKLREELIDGQETAKAERQSIKDSLLVEINLVKGNPAIAAGNWVKKYPKTACIAFILIVVIINLWFVSDFRSPMLEALGFPVPIITMIP